MATHKLLDPAGGCPTCYLPLNLHKAGFCEKCTVKGVTLHQLEIEKSQKPEYRCENCIENILSKQASLFSIFKCPRYSKCRATSRTKNEAITHAKTDCNKTADMPAWIEFYPDLCQQASSTTPSRSAPELAAAKKSPAAAKKSPATPPDEEEEEGSDEEKDDLDMEKGSDEEEGSDDDKGALSEEEDDESDVAANDAATVASTTAVVKCVTIDPCKACPGRVFRTAGERMVHKCELVKLFVCDYCDAKPMTREMQLAHITKDHPDKRLHYNYFWKDLKTDQDVHFALDIGMMAILTEVKVFDKETTKAVATLPVLWEKFYHEKTGLLRNMHSRVNGPLRTMVDEDKTPMTQFLSKMKKRMATTYEQLHLGSPGIVLNENVLSGYRNSCLKSFCEAYLPDVIDDVRKRMGMNAPTSKGVKTEVNDGDTASEVENTKKRKKDDEEKGSVSVDYWHASFKRDQIKAAVDNLAAREGQKGKNKLTAAEVKELKRLKEDLVEANTKVLQIGKKMEEELGKA